MDDYGMNNAPKLTSYGAKLETARKRRGLSQRKASKAAGVSEGWWRQVVSGVQKRGGMEIPVRPTADTLAAMARAAGADVREVFAAAGMSTILEVGELRRGIGESPLSTATDEELLDEVRRRMRGDTEESDTSGKAPAPTPLRTPAVPIRDDAVDDLEAAASDSADTTENDETDEHFL